LLSTPAISSRESTKSPEISARWDTSFAVYIVLIIKG